MPITSLLETAFKWLFLASLVLLAVTFVHKDRLPDPTSFDDLRLEPPLQTPTERAPFVTQVRDQAYRIAPRYDYELHGVVVSYSDADAIKNIWHHASWQDFINVRDLCVVWGENVRSGVYHQMAFRNDSWTCWAGWAERTVGERFQMSALANNHLLTDDARLMKTLMAVEPGDQIRLRGVLADYANLGNGYARGTSVTREDTGNGACETIYLDEIEIIRKANPGVRRLHDFARWLALTTGVGFLVMLPIAPVRVRRRR